MADPVFWNEDEGYDIHVLRGGPPSKPLDKASGAGGMTNSTVTFIPNFKGAPNAQGLTVDPATGAVTAAPHPAPPQPKFANFNFLMTLHEVIGGVGTFETEIRIHVHDSIRKIWLTPSTLTVHVGSNENRFTVLALFDDGTVGDITDWLPPQVPLQLTYQSSAGPVKVLNIGDQDPDTGDAVKGGGFLVATAEAGEAVITAKLDLASPSTHLSTTAKVFAARAWFKIAREAKVKFIDGPVRPDEKDLTSSKTNSVKSTVTRNTNILFVSEGFTKNDKEDFKKYATDIVRQLRLKTTFQPFGVLRNSINYWSVFVESRDAGVSVLGDLQIEGAHPLQAALQTALPRAPASPATSWILENLIHEGGLPLPTAAPLPDPAAWEANRANLYNIPAHPPIDPIEVVVWNESRTRTLLNERDTAFGMAHYDFPRASGQEQTEWRLLPHRRRTNKASFRIFLENLAVGQTGSNEPGFPIGETWVEDMSGSEGGKDFGLVCFLCQSATRGASAASSFFTASTGLGYNAFVKTVANGSDVLRPAKKSSNWIFASPVIASAVAHGCGHALGLADENGAGDQIVALDIPTDGPNLQAETLVTNAAPGKVPRVITPSKIGWLWPRIVNAGSIEVSLGVDPVTQQPVVLSPANCDAAGNPAPAGAFLLVRPLRPAATAFQPGDLTRLRGSVVIIAGSPIWKPSSEDPIAAFPLNVTAILSSGDMVLERLPVPAQQVGYLPVAAGASLDPSMFLQVAQCWLIQPLMVTGAERALVSDAILNHLAASNSSLNAPAGSQGAGCTPAPFPLEDVSPDNLPALNFPRKTPASADIIGLYDGGGNRDCGIFRAAGRCTMRSGIRQTTPFCHVCRYVIVEKVNPTLHRKLDQKFYDKVYPT